MLISTGRKCDVKEQESSARRGRKVARIRLEELGRGEVETSAKGDSRESASSRNKSESLQCVFDVRRSRGKIKE